MNARLRHTSHWLRYAPGLQTLLNYRAAWLRHDIAAGLILSTVLIPIGIAYAVAAGVPAIYGLYATIVPLLVYAIFGPSRILVFGPDSSMAIIIFAVVAPLSDGDPARAISIAAAMAIVSGLICICAGLAGLGFITELLSKPIRYGYINGIALAVLIAQIPKLLGFSSDSEEPLNGIVGILTGVLSGHANWTAFAIGAATLALIVMLKRFPRLPAMLIAITAATLVVGLLGLAKTTGIEILGALPQGLPSFALPRISHADLSAILFGGAATAMVAFADTSVLSRAYAARQGTRPNPNQEMIGLGAANLAAGLFQGFPISSSTSRTPVAEKAGAKTQLTGIVSAIAVTIVLTFAPDLLYHLPTAALAAVVISAAVGLIEVRDLQRIHRIQAWEFWLSIACTLGVFVFGPIQGVGIAVGIAIVEFVWDAWRPYSAILGRVPGLKGYHDISRYPNAAQIPGLVLLRWDSPLFFANAEWFSARVQEAIAGAPKPVRWLVIAAAPVTSVDVTAADMLVELKESLAGASIALHFAEMKDPVKDKLKRFGLFERFGESAFAPTLGVAVSRYRKAYTTDAADLKPARSRSRSSPA